MIQDIDLTGYIDLHIHTAPDIIPRKLTDIKATQQAIAANMAGIMIKSHVTCTADRATIAQQAVGNAIRVWGGLVLNRAVGGFNPMAVEVALQFGARQIWMPTLDAHNHYIYDGRKGVGLSVLDDDGAISSTVKEILSIIAEADVILGTGHISIQESVKLVAVARDIGVKRILITHPDMPLINMPVDIQQELARDGCYFDRCWYSTMPAIINTPKGLQPELLIKRIRTVGIASTVLSSDLGQMENPTPVDGFKKCIADCFAAGLSKADIQHMVTVNPLNLLQ